MQISNDDLARMLGRIEANLGGLAESAKRQEGALASLDKKLSERGVYAGSVNRRGCG